MRPTRLMTGIPKYTPVAATILSGISGTSARNLAHGINDLQRERGFLENVVRSAIAAFRSA
jgi:hypothetical protein